MFGIGRETFSKAFVELDRPAYLPKRYVMILPDGKSTRDFRVTEVLCDRPVAPESWRIPDDRGWKVTQQARWVSRLIKPDLVP